MSYQGLPGMPLKLYIQTRRAYDYFIGARAMPDDFFNITPDEVQLYSQSIVNNVSFAGLQLSTIAIPRAQRKLATFSYDLAPNQLNSLSAVNSFSIFP